MRAIAIELNRTEVDFFPQSIYKDTEAQSGWVILPEVRELVVGKIIV